MLSDGPEPENTSAEPNFVAGSGTEDDPFILAPVGPLQPGAIESTVEEITVGNMGDISVQMIDHNDDNNGKVTVSTDVDITIFSNNGKEANKESSVPE